MARRGVIKVSQKNKKGHTEITEITEIFAAHDVIAIIHRKK